MAADWGAVTPTVPLRSLDAPTLEWRADRWLGRTATLWDADRVAATIRFEGVFERSARLVTADGAWTLRLHGMRGRRTVVADPPRALAIDYTPGWFAGGRARLSNDVELRWRVANLWRGEWAFRWRDEDVLAFRRLRILPRPAFRVSWGRVARDLPELEGLVGLGWWLMRSHRHHGH